MTNSMVFNLIMAYRRCSSTVGLAIRSLDAQNGRHCRFLSNTTLPKEKSSDKSPWGTSVGYPTYPVIGHPRWDKSPDELPFDYIGCDPGAMKLMRKSKDEIVFVDVSEYPFDKYYYHEEECDGPGPSIRRLFMNVVLFYGERFKKFTEFDVQYFPDDHDRILVRSATMSVKHISGGKSATHFEELEDFFKRRGIDHQTLNFLFNFLQRRQEMDEECSPIGRKVRALGNPIQHPRAVFSVDSQHRSGGRCLPGVQLLPCGRFSTNPLTNAVNLTDDVPACSHLVAPIPSDVPFTVRHCLGPRSLVLGRTYQEESVEIFVGDLNRDDVDDPFIPLEVYIRKGEMVQCSKIILMSDRIEVRHLSISGAEEAFEEYLETRQIISGKICRLLWDRLDIHWWYG